MDPYDIVQEWLQHASIQALVAGRWAEERLPPGVGYPAIVYQAFSGQAEPNLDHADGSKLAMVRLQFNPLAVTKGEVVAIHAALRALLDFTHGAVVGGKHVVSCRFDLLGPPDRDEDLGLYTQSVDYVLRYYE